MDTRRLSVGLLALSLLAGTGALALTQPGQPPAKAASKEADEEQVITLDKAPAAVRAAAIKLAGDAKNITKVIREEDEEDVTTFEIEYNDGAAKCSAVLSTAGDVMELERPTITEKLPAALLAALKKDYPKATFENTQIVTRTFYEIDIVIDGKKHSIKADAAGNIEDEAKGGDEEHEHAKGGEHGEKHEGKKGEKDEDDKD